MTASNDQRVRTTTRSWAAECEAADLQDGQKPRNPPAYRFSNGREFKPSQDFYDTKPHD